MEQHGQKSLIGDAASWLRGRSLNLAKPLRVTILGALRDGWAIGTGAAHAVIGRPATAPPAPNGWATWTPGGPISAAGRGLQRLLADADVTITSVADNRFDAMAKVLADGLDNGGDIDEIADDLRPLLNDRRWARTIAVTETSRAISAAAWETYEQYGVTKMSWQVADDDRCGVCADNASAGLIDINDRFPSGDVHPPAHPNCRCAVIPDDNPG